VRLSGQYDRHNICAGGLHEFGCFRITYDITLDHTTPLTPSRGGFFRTGITAIVSESYVRYIQYRLRNRSSWESNTRVRNIVRPIFQLKTTSYGISLYLGVHGSSLDQHGIAVFLSKSATSVGFLEGARSGVDGCHGAWAFVWWWLRWRVGGEFWNIGEFSGINGLNQTTRPRKCCSGVGLYRIIFSVSTSGSTEVLCKGCR